MKHTEESGTECRISGPFFRLVRINCGVKRPSILDFISIRAREYGAGLVTTTRGLANLEEKPAMPLIYVRVLEDMIGQGRVRSIMAELRKQNPTM